VLSSEQPRRRHGRPAAAAAVASGQTPHSRAVQDKIAVTEAKIADLDMQIAESQRREALLARRIEAKRAQLKQLARAAYAAPESALVVLAESESLSDLLTRIADLNVAGTRAPRSNSR